MSIAHCKLLFLVLLYAVFPGTMFPGHASAQSKHCDPFIRQNTNDHFGYQSRKGRCEGSIGDPLSASSGSIPTISFTQARRFNAKKSKALRIEWPVVENNMVHLRATSPLEPPFYRMDSLQNSEAGSFIWPINILHGLDIKPEVVALRAWTKMILGGKERRVHLPASISYDNLESSDGEQELEVIVRPNTALRTLSLTIHQVNTQGSSIKVIQQNTVIGQHFAARHPIRIPLVNITIPGIYYLEFVGESINETPGSGQFWFKHLVDDGLTN